MEEQVGETDRVRDVLQGRPRAGIGVDGDGPVGCLDVNGDDGLRGVCLRQVERVARVGGVLGCVALGGHLEEADGALEADVHRRGQGVEAELVLTGRRVRLDEETVDQAAVHLVGVAQAQACAGCRARERVQRDCGDRALVIVGRVAKGLAGLRAGQVDVVVDE